MLGQEWVMSLVIRGGCHPPPRPSFNTQDLLPSLFRLFIQSKLSLYVWLFIFKALQQVFCKFLPCPHMTKVLYPCTIKRMERGEEKLNSFGCSAFQTCAQAMTCNLLPPRLENSTEELCPVISRTLLQHGTS